MSSGPPSRNEKPRSAWSSCIEETPTSITTPSTAADALRRADLGEVGESVLDQGQPAVGLVDQIEAAGNRRPVAVDADDPGSRDSEDRAAVAAGAEGRVDIDAAVTGDRASRPPRGRERRYGVAQPGSCAVPWRIPACEMEDGRERAHCASNLCASPGFSGQKAANRHDRRLRARPRAPSFPDGICWAAMAFRARKRASAVPNTGSALHHLVTALSVKKALMIGCGFCALSSHVEIR